MSRAAVEVPATNGAVPATAGAVPATAQPESMAAGAEEGCSPGDTV